MRTRDYQSRFSPEAIDAPANKYKIEKGVPLHDWRRFGEKGKLLGMMELHDSILFDDCTNNSLRAIASRHIGKKFAIRSVEGGFRIWRTS